MTSAVDQRPAHDDGHGYRDRAAYYAVEYQDDADRAFLADRVGPDVDGVLEVPCGAGRNALWLAETGRRIVACDLEPAMLDALAARYPGGRVPENLELVTGDMRALDLGERFDRVFVPREALQLLTDLADAGAALNALGRHVAPGGRMIVDLAAFRAAAPDMPDGPGLQPSYFDPDQPDGTWVRDWLRPAPDGRWLARWHSQRQGGTHVDVGLHYRLYATPDDAREDHPLTSWDGGFSLRRWTRAEIEGLVHAAGLAVQAAHADYDGTPHREGAARMILELTPVDVSPRTAEDDRS